MSPGELTTRRGGAEIKPSSSSLEVGGKQLRYPILKPELQTQHEFSLNVIACQTQFLSVGNHLGYTVLKPRIQRTEERDLSRTSSSVNPGSSQLEVKNSCLKNMFPQTPNSKLTLFGVGLNGKQRSVSITTLLCFGTTAVEELPAGQHPVSTPEPLSSFCKTLKTQLFRAHLDSTEQPVSPPPPTMVCCMSLHLMYALNEQT